MFSTPKKRLFELKKELRCVKKIMDCVIFIINNYKML